MSFFDEARKTARTDSRRFAKSILCKIIWGAPALDFLSMNNLVPLDAQQIDPKLGIDNIRGKLIAMTRDNYDIFSQLLRESSGPPIEQGEVSAPGQVKPAISEEEKEKRLKQNSLAIAMAQQNLISISVSLDRVPSSHYSPENYDLLVETVDVGQALDVQFVPSGKINLRTGKKWSDR